MDHCQGLKLWEVNELMGFQCKKCGQDMDKTWEVNCFLCKYEALRKELKESLAARGRYAAKTALKEYDMKIRMKELEEMLRALCSTRLLNFKEANNDEQVRLCSKAKDEFGDASHPRP